MNARFQCFGFAVARRHVYFYSMLIAATFFANTIKTSLLGNGELDADAARDIAEIQHAVIEVQADLASFK
jgi:hypothetical protein